MQILVSTDSHIEGSAKLTHYVETIVQQAIGHLGDRITRVAVYLSDENSSQKSGDDDKRCVIEARLGGLRPITVSHVGSTVDQALGGAADKLEETLKRSLARRGSLFKRRVRERAELAEVAPLLDRDMEIGEQEDFIKLLRPLLGHIGHHARRELQILEASGTLHPGQVIFTDLLDEAMTRAWLQFSDRPSWMSLDLWLTKMLDEILEEKACQTEQSHETLYGQSKELLQQNVPQIGNHEWWICLLGEDEMKIDDNAVPGRQSAWAEAFLEAEEIMFGVHAQLGRLPRTKRQAFVLNVLEAYDPSQIAKLQCRSELEVRNDIESARDQLRERLSAGGRLHNASSPEAAAACSTGKA